MLLLRLILPLALTLAACGRPSPEQINHRSDRPYSSGESNEIVAPPTPKATATAPTPTQKKLAAEPKAPPPKLAYDETLDRTASAFFYQSEPELSDLFAPNGTSQLCWPTTLAYTLESLRSAPEAPLSRLKKPSVRDLASLCGTDREAGTTMPQGVTCVDALMTTAGYTPNLKVTGLDAKWKSFGLYPEQTHVAEAEVSPAVIRSDLKAGARIILFIGYYNLDQEKGVWTRLRGHFVTVTGFSYRTEWDDEIMDLHIVNPGTDYRSESGSDLLQADLVRMSRLFPTSPLPKEVAFELQGPHFKLGDGTVAAVESILEIQAN